MRCKYAGSILMMILLDSNVTGRPYNRDEGTHLEPTPTETTFLKPPPTPPPTSPSSPTHPSTLFNSTSLSNPNSTISNSTLPNLNQSSDSTSSTPLTSTPLPLLIITTTTSEPVVDRPTGPFSTAAHHVNLDFRDKIYEDPLTYSL